ncbi:MAG TPA: hypothetical protein VI756_02920, partial [Blastocatellia bacterium]
MKTTDQGTATQLWTSVILRVVAALLAGAALLWVFYSLRTILLLLIVCIFFCYMIAPIVSLFEQPLYVLNREIRVPRGISILLVYLVIGAILFAIL